MSDIYQFNVGGTTYNLANLGLLAPVQITLTADRLYNTGDQFIYTGLLYEATETIAQGTSITIGSNAQLADCVTKQISEINSNLVMVESDSIPASGDITSLIPPGYIPISGVATTYSGANAIAVIISRLSSNWYATGHTISGAGLSGAVSLNGTPVKILCIKSIL